MPFVEDFTVFFADFGVTATPNVGAAVTVIFDRAHIEAAGGDISGTQPVALAVSADVSAWDSHQTEVRIAGAKFAVRDIQPDGTGLSLLVLEVL
jgi:hypothetical protein